MRQLMAHQEPALQADESLLELAETSDTKRCAACRIVKPVSEYYKDRTHSRGIKTRCKDCLRACKEAFKNQQRAKSAAEQVRLFPPSPTVQVAGHSFAPASLNGFLNLLRCALADKVHSFYVRSSSLCEQHMLRSCCIFLSSLEVEIRAVHHMATLLGNPASVRGPACYR